VPLLIMWTRMSWRILRLFVPLYIRRDNGPRERKTPDSAVSLIAAVFHQAAGVMDSSIGRHSLYFQSAYPRCKTTDGIRSFLKRPRNSHWIFWLNHTEHLSLNLSSQTGKHSLFCAGNISVTSRQLTEWISGGDLNKHSELIEWKISMYCQVYVYSFMDIWKCLLLFEFLCISSLMFA
jgi:hypothetical protein